MITREEHLKKINDHLEKMSDEELEKIAGGEYRETSGDSFLLHKLGLCTYYSEFDIEFEIGTAKEEEVQAAWKAVGINFIWHGDLILSRYAENFAQRRCLARG